MGKCTTSAQDFINRFNSLSRSEEIKKLKSLEEKVNFIVSKIGISNKNDIPIICSMFTNQKIIQTLEVALNNYISKNRNTKDTIQEQEDKVAQIEDRTPDSVSLDRKNIKDWFINNSVIYTQVESRFKRDIIINCFIKGLDIQQAIADMQNIYWKNIYTYLKKVEPEFAKQLSDQLYKRDEASGNYIYQGQLTKENITKIKRIITENYRLKQDNLYDLSTRNPMQYRALTALALLSGFDNFIKWTCGNSIRIKDNLGNFTTLDKYEIQISNKQSDSWRTSEDIAYSEDWSSLFKSLITIIPIYNSNGLIIENRTLTIAEFNKIINQIREIRFKDNIALFRYSGSKWITDYNLEEYLDYLKQNNIRTLHDLIAHMRLNPEKDLQILFELFKDQRIFNKYIEYDARQIVKSFGKQLYEGTNAYINAKSDIPIYFFIAKVIASTSVLEYTQEYFEEDTDHILTIRLSSTMYDRTKSMLSAQLDSRYPLAWSANYDELISEENGKRYSFTLDSEENLIISIKYNNDTINIKINPKNTSIKDKVLSITDSSGEPFKPTDRFIQQIFNDVIGFSVDEQFFSAYKNMKNDDMSLLLDFSIIVISSAYAKYNNKEEFFGKDDKRKLITSTGEKSIIPNSYSNILKDIALAYDISKNNTNKSATNDSQGNSIGVFSPSRLFEGWDYINRFIINKGVLQDLKIRELLKNIIPFREFKGQKNSIEFTPNEVFYNSFMVNFIGNLYQEKTNSIPSSILIHPYVISDKSVVLYGDISYPQLLEILKSKGVEIKSTTDLFSEQSLQAIHSLIKEDLGKVYADLFTGVGTIWKQVYDRLNNIINDPEFIIDPYNDFQAFNKWLKKEGLSIYDFNLKYSEQLRGITLFEELHYVKDLKGNLRFNRTLLSLYCRLNNKTAGEVSPVFSSLRIPTYNEFIQDQEVALVRDLFENNTRLKVPSYLVKSTDTSTGIIDKSWIIGDYLVIAKKRGTEIVDGKVKEVIYPIYNINDYYEALTSGTLIINPYLKTYNWLHYLFSQEISLATAGTYLINPAKGSVKSYDGDWDAYEEENERYTTATKRKVGMSANIDLFIPCRKGLPKTIKIATIEEATTSMFNYVGDEGKANVQDGMTYVNGTSSELERASLGSQASKGYVTKPLEVGFDAQTGTQLLIKTASQSLTGYNQRRSHSNKIVNANMQDSYELPADFDLTISDEGNTIEYNCYYRSFSYSQEGKPIDVYYKISDLKRVGNYTYEYKQTQVDISGKEVAQSVPQKAYISTIYDLYLLIGGENSVSFEGDYLSYKNNNDQAANKTIAYVMGQKEALKDYLIHQAPTSGAIKCGGANINPKKVLNERHSLSTQVLDLGRSGTQLDKTHEAEGAHISILTQVMNALSARGYTQEKAREVYEVVHNICVNAALDFIEIADNINNSGEADIKQIQQFKQLLADTIIDRLVSGSTDYVALLAQWFTDLNDKGLVTFKDKSLPLSMNSVYNQCLTTIASSVSKLGIKLKFNGLLAVLCPSHGIYRLFGNKTMDEFKGYTDIKLTWDNFVNSIQKPENLQAALRSGDLIPSYKLSLGTSYAVFDANGQQLYDIEGNPLIVDISTPYKYKEIRAKYKDYYFKENWYTIQKNTEIKKGEYYIDENGQVQQFKAQQLDESGNRIKTMIGTKFTPQGRDLEPYNVFFGGLDNTTGEYNHYCLWDLKAISNMWEVRGDRFKTIQARKNFQKIINALEHKQSIDVELNDGSIVTVDTSNIEIKAYENICPSINLPEFGIEPGTNLSEITPQFFENVIKQRRQLTASDANYDYAIRNLDGNHLYIINDLQEDPESRVEGLYQLDEDRIAYVSKNSGVETWVLDERGDRLFKLTSNGKNESNDIVYQDSLGNIFVRTKNINELIEENSNRGDTIHLSESISLEGKLIPINKKDKISIKEFIWKYTEGTQEQKTNTIKLVYSGQYDISNVIGELPEDILNDIRTRQSIIANLSQDFNIEMGKNIDTIVDQNIKKDAQQIYSAFLTTLETIASRTPSQSMQSFMAMKTVAFDNTGVNNVYVSPYQLWLQGSDFDIDAASMLGYEISKNGKFIGWSPFFNQDSKQLLDLSFKLPFPTGKNSEVSTWNLVSKREQQSTKDWIKEEKEAVKGLIDAFKNPNTIYNLQKIINFIRKVNKQGFPKIVSDDANLLQELVDKHNRYFINKKGKVRTKLFLKAGNNFISRGIYEIIKSPANVIQAQAPIDTYADVAKEVGRGIRNLDLPVFRKTVHFQNTTIDGVSIIKVNKPWKDNPTQSNSTYRIYLDARLGRLKDGRFKKELVVSDADPIYYTDKLSDQGAINEVADLADIPYFELVIDHEAGNYSVHFKAKRKNELTQQEKETLFQALAVLIPEGGNVSTYGTLTKGGKMGVIRLGRLIGNKVVGVRAVKEKFLANESQYANLPGNSFNLGVEQATNSTGKKCIEITAASMKSLESVINATNQTILDINEFNEENIKYIKSSFNLLGRHYQVIANSYGENTSKAAQEIINAARNDIDSLLELSVLLTLSTDNAKELILSKIIALEETMSLYVAGVAYGLSISELSQVMVSKSMKSLIRIMKPNFFNKYEGYNRFSRIIKYVEGNLGLTMDQSKSLGAISGLSKKISECFVDDEGNHPVISFITYERDSDMDGEGQGTQIPNEFLASLPNLNLESLQKFRKVITDTLNSNTKEVQECVDILLKIQDWISIKSTIISDSIVVFDPSQVTEGVGGDDCIKTLSVWEELKKLSIIGEQFSELAAIDSINKEIKTKPEEFLNYLVRFEDMLESQALRTGKKTKQLGKVDLSKFLRDAGYRQEIFNKYEELLVINDEKVGINIPYIIANNVQYMGYLRDMEALLTGYRTSITRFRLTESLFRKIKRYIPYDQLERAVKNIGIVVNSFVINSWLQNQKPVIIPSGTTIYTDNTTSGSNMVTTVADTPIQLGTDSGNRSFKEFMEKVLIPKLKKGNANELLDIHDVSLQDNLFIKDLALVADPNTVSGEARYEYSLYIEMNRLNTPYDSDTFVKHKRALQQLKAYNYKGYSLYELFYLYNLIVFNDVASKYNYSPLFNDDVTNRSSELINNYINYWKDFDNSPDIKPYINEMQVLSEIAPKGKKQKNKITKYYYKGKWITSNGNTTYVNPRINKLSIYNKSMWLSPSIQIEVTSNEDMPKINKIVYKGKEFNYENPLDILFVRKLTTKAYKYDIENQKFTEESYTKDVQLDVDAQLTIEAIERLFNDPCK